MTLPPGQHLIREFPRFGTHLHKPPPPIPDDLSIEIRGPVRHPVRLPLAELGGLPHRAMTADFHCVAGWTATDLHWEGVPFSEFYRLVIKPALLPDTTPTHFVFHGLDRYHSLAHADDALAEDVLIAQHLNGQPLTPGHGAPIRLLSPSQYGFVSCKHLCAIDVLDRHPRSRVWHEERNRTLPNWLIRPVYRWVLTPPLRAICALGADGTDDR